MTAPNVGTVSVGIIPVGKISLPEIAARISVAPDVSGLGRRVSAWLDKLPVKVPVAAANLDRVISAARQLRSGLRSTAIDGNPVQAAISSAADHAERIRQSLVESTRSMVDVTKRSNGLSDSVTVMRRLGEQVRKFNPAAKLTGTERAAGEFRKVRDRASEFGRIGEQCRSRLSDLGKNAGKLSSSASHAASSFSSVQVLGGLALIAPVIGVISAVLAGIPSVIAAIAAPIAAVALGFDGLKAAFSALDPQIARLKSVLSATFQRELSPMVDQLRVLFPVLEQGLSAVAIGLVAMGKGFTDIVTSATGLEQIRNILSNVGTFLGLLRPMVTDLSAGFLNLASVGSQEFGLLTDLLTRFGQQFRVVTERMTTDGSFQSAIAGLAEVTDAVLQGFLKVFESGVQTMGQVAGPLSTVITAFVDGLVALMPSAAATANLVLGALTGILQVWMPTIHALVAPIQLAGQMLGELLVGAMQGLAPVLGRLVKVVRPLIPVFAGLLQQVTRLIPSFYELAGVWISKLIELIQLMNPLVMLLIRQFVTLLPSTLAVIVAMNQLSGQIVSGLLTALAPLIPAFVQLGQAWLPVFVLAYQTAVTLATMVAQFFTQMIPVFVALSIQVTSVLVPVFQGLITVVRAFGSVVGSVIQAAMGVIQGLLTAATGVITGN